MATLVNTLYPPVVPTFMPAFPNDKDAVIYFSLSPLNASASIQRVHVTLVNQANNENALNKASGVLIQSLKMDTSNGLYYVTIPTSMLKGGNTFNINQFYKVQIRFDSYNGTVPTEEVQLNAYLLDYQTYFSEWSTVCLIRPILQPSIELRTFDTNDSDIIPAFNKGIIPISGKMFFGGDIFSLETETLQSYQIQILKNDGSNKVVYETPTIYTGNNINPNDINYKLDLQGLDTLETTIFKMRIIATTRNQYELIKDYPFQIADFIEEENFKPALSVSLNRDEGIVELKIDNTETVFGTLYIKRSSSVSDFKEWEPISITKEEGTIHKTIYDNTVGSLIWYQYSVQLENSRGALTQVYRTEKILPDFYDAILSRGDKQITIRYDFKITNFKTTVNRSKIDTLGGRYPKFVENAVLNYKQFGISGKIDSSSDYNQLFLNKQSYFAEDYLNYTIYKEQHGVKDLIRNDAEGYADNPNELLTTTMDDWMWQRIFRSELEKWLNDGEPKLFRSMTEGVIPVMITDISLTPNVSTGRYIWDFTATCYEIEDGHSLTKLDELGIIDVPKIETDYRSGGDIEGGDGDEEYVEVIKVGQLYYETLKDKTNILSSIIAPALQERYGGVLSSKIPSDFYLKDVKIFFHNNPHIFLQTANGLMLVEDPGSSIYTQEQRDRMQMGYSFEVSTTSSEGSTKIFVDSKGYYQLSQNLDITEISFPQIGDVVTVDYTIIYKEKNNPTNIVTGTSVDKTIVGQECGVYKPDQYLGELIRAKYNFVKTGEFYKKMQYWQGICLDVTPYAVAHIQYKGETEFNDYLVGFTGMLHLQENYPVQDMCFLGRRMTRVNSNQEGFTEPWEYVLKGENPPQKPHNNTAWMRNGKLQIYYQDAWYDLIDNGDGTALAKVPVEGMINYTGQVITTTL